MCGPHRSTAAFPFSSSPCQRRCRGWRLCLWSFDVPSPMPAHLRRQWVGFQANGARLEASAFMTRPVLRAWVEFHASGALFGASLAPAHVNSALGELKRAGATNGWLPGAAGAQQRDVGIRRHGHCRPEPLRRGDCRQAACVRTAAPRAIQAQRCCVSSGCCEY